MDSWWISEKRERVDSKWFKIIHTSIKLPCLMIICCDESLNHCKGNICNWFISYSVMISSVYKSRFHFANSAIEFVEFCLGKLQLSSYIVWMILKKGFDTTKTRVFIESTIQRFTLTTNLLSVSLNISRIDQIWINYPFCEFTMNPLSFS